jgi:hypothetical protein
MNDYNYSYSYSYPTGADAAAGTAVGLGFVLVSIFISFLVFAAVYVAGALLLGQIFKKAGQPRWIAWVPIYNSWKYLEIGGQQGFWAILAIIPVVNIVSAVFHYIAAYHIGLKLKKPGEFVLLAIFLPLVWFLILALDHSTWEQGDKPSATPPTVPPAAS